MTLRLLGIQGREPWDTKGAFATDPHVLDISKRVFGQCCVRTTYMGVYVQFTWDNLVGAKATPSMNYLFHRRLLEWLSTSNLGWAYLHISKFRYNFIWYNVSSMKEVESRHESLETKDWMVSCFIASYIPFRFLSNCLHINCCSFVFVRTFWRTGWRALPDSIRTFTIRASDGHQLKSDLTFRTWLGSLCPTHQMKPISSAILSGTPWFLS